MKKTILVFLAALLFSGSVLVTGCTSAEFWEATSNIRIEKTLKVNAPDLNYRLTIKIKIESNVMFLTVAGYECEPINLKEIFTEADSDNIEFTMSGANVKDVLVNGITYEVKQSSIK